ncbi:MAG: DUF4422 domain-containing protein [Selenomonadaceae bacterium]|nr:DUF4422 domain-containing protein [Selenomonadaceae bacterium]MBR4694815.1 DUF4422 domain-containing protein [Selenomonadaceae bacterium]
MVIDFVHSMDKFYIYGAQVVAYGAYRAIKHLTDKVPLGFLVSDKAGNPGEIEGVGVILPQQAEKGAAVLVAVSDLLHESVATVLQSHGFSGNFFLTAHEEHLLMSAYFGDMGRFPLAEVAVCDAIAIDFAMYEVCSHRDKPLGTRPALASFEQSIQAGAVLTRRRIVEFGDDTDENISVKNRQYCEMSAVYWIWKNRRHDWVGIEHYRRHLLVKPGMLGEDVDAILPLPYICYPNTLAQFRRFVSEDVLQALLRALRDLHPNEYEGYLAILQGKYQYTYNLVCARQDVFDDYCTWFFHITEYMEGMADEVPEIGNTRALSYVAEVLTNLYFMSNSKKLRLRHVEKAIYV